MKQTTPESSFSIRISPDNQQPKKLEFGGTNPSGNTISVNQRYLELDGKPWLPVMGEFHFSRYPREDWRDELLKMKAGGISVIATYIFWIHIEETEGIFNWGKNNDLRHFIQLSQDLNLFAYPRIGPWAHGECRNGGFPDWLRSKCASKMRQNAQPYLSYVKRFYQEIYRQIDGLLWKDGGPIIGIQIENELTNNAGHILTLKKIAQEVGFDVPLYTMTGWGPAQIPSSGVIPVFGGYPDAFWDRQVDHWADSSKKHYFFTAIRDDNTIGADLNPRNDIEDLSHLVNYPYGTCEVGGGMQVAYHRRPIISADDVAALAQVKIGNGSNLQGYYMYHGGSNPIGRKTTMQESQATGYPNDLPVIDYDFQAPLGEYGQVRESYRKLRLLHLFLQDFGGDLATYPSFLPPEQPGSLDDRTTLRWAARSDGRKGFLFINNYQRIDHLSRHDDVQFQVILENEILKIPLNPVSIPENAYLIWPFNMDCSGALLHYATAQPVCHVDVDACPTYVFTAIDGIDAEFVFDAGSLDLSFTSSAEGHKGVYLSSSLWMVKPENDHLVTIKASDGKKVAILLLSHERALTLNKAILQGREYLVFANGSLVVDGNRLKNQLTGADLHSISIYPKPPVSIHAVGYSSQTTMEGIFTTIVGPKMDMDPRVNVEVVKGASPARIVPIGPGAVAQAPDDADFEEAQVYRITFPDGQKSISAKELLLEIDYIGDAARMVLDGILIEDDFYCGRPWEIGLSRFGASIIAKGIELRILPLHKGSPIYLAESAWPDFNKQDEIARLISIKLKPIYEIIFELS